MKSQVQVLAGPPLFSQLRALPPQAGRTHCPAWAASGPHAQLQAALEHRWLIEQAKGVLMGREDLDAQAAFERLRGAARSSTAGWLRWPRT